MKTCRSNSNYNHHTIIIVPVGPLAYICRVVSLGALCRGSSHSVRGTNDMDPGENDLKGALDIRQWYKTQCHAPWQQRGSCCIVLLKTCYLTRWVIDAHVVEYLSVTNKTLRIVNHMWGHVGGHMTIGNLLFMWWVRSVSCFLGFIFKISSCGLLSWKALFKLC